MRTSKPIKFIIFLVVLAAAAAALYRVPAVNRRLAWRVDFAMTYLRGVLQPAGAMPTALPHREAALQPAASISTATSQPTASATPLPSTATPTPVYTPTATPSPTPIPAQVVLTAPQWEKQDINNCGPTTLSMYLRYWGWEGDQETISREIKPLREDRNVNVEEVDYFVRNFAGWLNIQYRVGGDLDLLKQLLAAGLPVMIEESFHFEETYWPNDDQWAAHYNLLTGYDDAAGVFTSQDSFYGADQKVPYEKLDEYWQSFNRVYILVYPPDREETVKRILGDHWDPAANRRHALETARTETGAQPQNSFAWFNLGNNLTYFEQYTEAAEAFDKAREIGLPQRMLRYQFTPFMAYFHSGRIDDLMALTEYALQRTPNAEEALLWNGWGLYRQGKKNEALQQFYQALQENPNYADAQYAVNFVQGQ